MRGVRFSSMSITAFRGITDPVKFDFRSPLTLVYAPNGAGKTTMCEAAEWLLTGQIERLKDGKSFDSDVLISKFRRSDQQPSVVADLFLDDRPLSLSRIAAESHSIAELNVATESIRQGPHELLSLLAPAAAADEAHHMTAITLRQRWLKGTRFLSSEALAALVDTDEETIDRRTQVFADLLGIRHLLDAERQCEKYANELSSQLRTLSQLTSQRIAEAEELEQALAGGGSDLSSGTRSALLEAQAAATLLDAEHARTNVDNISLDEYLSTLTALHRRDLHALEERNKLTRQVEAQSSARMSLEQSVAEAERLESQLASQLAEIETNGRAASAKLAEHISKRDAASESVKALAVAKDQLARQSVSLIESIANFPSLSESPSSTFGSISAFFAESSWPGESREERRRQLAEVIDGSESAERAQRRLQSVEAELSSRRLTLVSEEALDNLHKNATETASRARAAQSLVDRTNDPVARIQAAARDLILHDHSFASTTCPLCSHDWGSTENLERAISSALASLPELVESARADAARMLAEARAAQQKLDDIASSRATILSLERERNQLLTAAEERRRGIERLGLSAQPTSLAFTNARRRLDIADGVAELLQTLADLEPALPGGAESVIPHETPIVALLDQIEAAFITQNHALQLQLANLADAIEKSIKSRDQLRSAHASTQQQLKDCRQSLSRSAAELASIRALWVAVAGNTPWSDDALDNVKTKSSERLRQLMQAGAHLEAAKATWELESRRTKLARLREEITPSVERQEFVSRRIAAANRARAVFHDAYEKTSRRQVQSLSRVVNPLFARMHANRVFDRIDLGEDNEFLHWLADAGGEKLDPGKDFSQGQRQDLALSLFLARARSLGGTFFLDEPVTHLDDLNRVGLLDVLRATALEGSMDLNLVVTTSSRSLARHLVEKFSEIDTVATPTGQIHPLRVVELEGNSRSGIQVNEIYPFV